MSFDWIFFDCFNTLLDEIGDETGLCSIRAKVVKWGFFPSEDEFLQTYRAGLRALGKDWTEITLVQRLTYCLNAAAPSTTISAEIAINELMECWHQEFPRILSPAPGVFEMLRNWRPRARLAVISNFYVPGLPAQYLHSHGMADFFEFILDSAALGHKKPGRRIYEHALGRAGVGSPDVSRVLFIGDRVDLDVVPPQSMGMQVIHFNRNSQNPARHLTPKGVRIIHSWDEFR
jgi:putative hydrolase of the HAD superfamily